jgi:hypothetical protein
MKRTENNILQEGNAMKDEYNSAGTDLRGRFDASAKPVVYVDFARYQGFLDHTEMTEAQREEFLKVLWSIIVAFIDLGYGIHPIQEVCGKDLQTGAPSPKAEFNRLGSQQEEEKLNWSGLIARLEAE